jgi:hypothetical protein
VCPLEGVIQGEIEVGVPFIGAGGTADIDFASIGQRQMDRDLVESRGDDARSAT